MAFNLNRLKAERVAHGYTQEEFARKLHMSREAYARRENGLASISVEDLSKILDILGYGADEIPIFFGSSVRKRERK